MLPSEFPVFKINKIKILYLPTADGDCSGRASGRTGTISGWTLFLASFFLLFPATESNLFVVFEAFFLLFGVVITTGKKVLRRVLKMK